MVCESFWKLGSGSSGGVGYVLLSTFPCTYFFFFFNEESFKMCCHQCGHSIQEKNDSVTWDLLISDSLTLFPDLCGTPINDPEP